ncbi:class I SAM-dependent methyltransferase [Thalassotalea psychrophila]|uniref:Class I SAM-dependent methyltransferase n=1 Tax=Thalassotalea psychrophila TaxID=3065647 RepID=A0ABY9TRM4_9GAMM|nr:class I SAM-dependent methyltransferase [Colwelliaceae bacterium SQ149]
MSSTDKAWEKFGKNNPYYGVCTEDKFRNSKLTAENKAEFFQSGDVYIENIINNVRRFICHDFKLINTLDFGCGVGRLAIPLSKCSETVIGVDISQSMLDEANRNKEIQKIKNVNFFKSDDDFYNNNLTFNFIHSFIVFQHIPIKIGEQIFYKLLSKLVPKGVGVIHFTYGKKGKVNSLVKFARTYIPFTQYFIHLWKGKYATDPLMQMNHYDLNTIFNILHRFKINNWHIEHIDQGGSLGIILYFKKNG